MFVFAFSFSNYGVMTGILHSLSFH